MRAQLERAAALSTRTQAEQKEPRGPFGFVPNLYEGGKKGYGFERQAQLAGTIAKHSSIADQLFSNASVAPYRHDEYEGGNSDDESLKRKNDFSDLFKRQMSMRKVSRLGTLGWGSFFFFFVAHLHASCWQTEGMGPSEGGRPLNGSQMLYSTGHSTSRVVSSQNIEKVKEATVVFCCWL